MALKGVRKQKSPPIMSHEFVIQNHADIVSCVAMVFVLGLMFQVSAPLAAVFVTLSHNASAFEDLPREDPVMLYTNGFRDIGAVLFYTLICIVIHAVIQEYILDKITKKLHLSKTRHAKFNESGQFLAFSALCAVWGLNIIYKEFTGVSSLWAGYPKEQAEMSFIMKFFFIIQMSYWIHCIPELYFQKVKKDEMSSKAQYPMVMLVLISIAYTMNFSRIALVLLVLRFIEESVMHLSRLFYLVDNTSTANTGFSVWNAVFVSCRLVSLIASILTFQYGLATIDSTGFSPRAGNWNTMVVRIFALVTSCFAQGYMMWTFFHFHLQRSSENTKQPTIKKKENKPKTKKPKKDDSKRSSEDDVSMLPEADQNTRRRK